MGHKRMRGGDYWRCGRIADYFRMLGPKRELPLDHPAFAHAELHLPRGGVTPACEYQYDITCRLGACDRGGRFEARQTGQRLGWDVYLLCANGD